MFHKSLVFAVLFSAGSVWACVGPTNAAIQSALNKDVAKYKTVSVTVDDCVAVLNGQVEKLSDKLAIARRARRYDALTAVSNRIVVAVPIVDDLTLVNHVSQELRHDRDRTGGMLSFAVSAHDGEVTVSGLVYSPMQHDDTLTLVASVRGVRNILDYIQVSPVASLSPYLYDPRTYIYGTACAGTIAQCGTEH